MAWLGVVLLRPVDHRNELLFLRTGLAKGHNALQGGRLRLVLRGQRGGVVPVAACHVGAGGKRIGASAGGRHSHARGAHRAPAHVLKLLRDGPARRQGCQRHVRGAAGDSPAAERRQSRRGRGRITMRPQKARNPPGNGALPRRGPRRVHFALDGRGLLQQHVRTPKLEQRCHPHHRHPRRYTAGDAHWHR